MKALQCPKCQEIFFDAEYTGVLYVGRGKLWIDDGVIMTSSLDVIERVEATQITTCPHCSHEDIINNFEIVDVDDLTMRPLPSAHLCEITWPHVTIAVSTTVDTANEANRLIKQLISML